MRKINILQNTIIKMCFLLLLFMPLAVFAEQETVQKLKVGDALIFYDEVLTADTDGNGINDRSSYYRDGKLVFTAYDRDENGADDLWFQYDNDLFLTKTFVDRNTDGKPDEVLHLNREEEITRIEKLEKKSFLLFIIIVVSIVIVSIIGFLLQRRIKKFISTFSQSLK